MTDADLVLGYIAPEATFGIEASAAASSRDRELAEKAIQERIADPLGLSLTDAALGIVEVANAKMANALENEIIGRGFDPRDFVLMSYGGAGPFHAAGYAQSLGIDTIVVPGEAASVWSAFGISQADIRYQYEASVVLMRAVLRRRARAARSSELEADARAALTEREDVSAFEFRRYARMRFQWQLHELEMRLARTRRSTRRAGGGDHARVRGDVRRALRRGRAAAGRDAARSSRCGSSRRSRWAPPRWTGCRWARASSARASARSTSSAARARWRRPSTTATRCRSASASSGPAVIDLAITGIVVPPGASCERRKTGDFVLTLEV